MTEKTNEIIEYGNLAIGIGTIAIAIVFGIISWRSTKSDRAVHIADKRQEWVNSFRDKISKSIALQIHYDSIIDDCSLEELDAMLREWSTLLYQIKFMFPSEMKVRDRLEDLFHEIFEELRIRKKTKDRSGDKLAKLQTDLINISDSIINTQRTKIVRLDSSNPLI
ncbi:hypothetical protein [Flagellimonas iocasae]|uniref:Uncharacterized protein n=1 Tax=Flagellimonas iocasae TaxID=2055905 RepID=A0ABW4XUE9_9FLAO